jgi:hypothetical protein
MDAGNRHCSTRLLLIGGAGLKGTDSHRSTQRARKLSVGYFYCLETDAIEGQWVKTTPGGNNVDLKAIHKRGQPLGSNT